MISGGSPTKAKSTDSRPTLRNVWNRTVATDKANDPVAVAPSRLGRGDEKSALETLQAHFRVPESNAFMREARTLAAAGDGPRIVSGEVK